MSEQKRLFLLDAYALIYRAYFAFGKNPLINSKGQNVSAISGFLNTIYDLVQKEKPTHLAIGFDLGAVDRTSAFAFYKAHRPETPEGISWAVPYIKQILQYLDIPILEVEGYEADDVIGTIAKRAEQDGFRVYMVTSDKDYGQLVSPNIFMYKPAYLKNPIEILGVPEVLKKWDIERVEQVIDMLGLMGDSSDNIPGIPGVGEKTANKLLKDFGSVEGILENADKLDGKLREKVVNGSDYAKMSKILATIMLDVPVEYNPDSWLYTPENIDRKAVANLFRELEFRTLGKRILGKDYELIIADNTESISLSTQTNNNFEPLASDAQLALFAAAEPSAATNTEAVGKNIHNTDHQYFLADTPEKRNELLQLLLQQTIVCFDTETTSVDANLAELVGMSFAYQTHSAWYVPVPDDATAAKALVAEFLPFFENENIAKVAQNIKYDLLVLKWYGVEMRGTLHDTMLAHYLLKPDLRHNMNYLSETYLQYVPVSIEELIGKKGKNQLSMRQVDVKKVAEYAAEDADVTLQLYQQLLPNLANTSLQPLYEQVEVPLASVLAAMEYEGVAVDTEFLQNYSVELGKEIETVSTEIYQLAGVPFNIASPKQLGDILFGVLNIGGDQKNKKTKTGQFSTDEDTLTRLAGEHEIVQKILDYRQLSKLRSTYVDALPALINPKTQRLHSNFNQTVAATGRLSSDNPNLQNIPIRTEKGREVRKAFVGRNSNFIIVSADYSQIELRLMAEMSGDDNMLTAFREGLDIHTATAARVFGVDIAQVDSDMRRKAKMVNFGIIYGITPFGLAQRLKIKRTEAAPIIEEYFKQYPKVKQYMDNSIALVRERGYTETILGRRRQLPDIYSNNPTVRGFAERNAINTPIQGSAADMIKAAMINIHAQIKQKGMQSRMILQVHDELVFDTLRSEVDELLPLVREGMQNALPNLKVPIEVGIGVGENWLAAH